MCNINVVYNKGRGLSYLPSMYMNVASSNSFRGNSHGEGMIGFRNKHINVYKSLFKLIYREAYWLLATHQRFATSGGVSKEKSHPYITKDLMLMHNGIFSGLGDKDSSDSEQFTYMLQAEYDKDRNLFAALKRIHKRVNGSYSVLIYLRGEKRVYYYRNQAASIYCVQNKDFLVLSTSDDNISYAKKFFRGAKDFKVEPGMLYEVTDSMRVVGRIKSIWVEKEEEEAQKELTDYTGYSSARDLPSWREFSNRYWRD